MTMKSLILFAFTLLVAVHSQKFCPAKYLNTNGFIKIGSYNGFNNECTPYAKTYYLSTLYKYKWYEAKQICEINGMEYLTLDTKDESDKFMLLFNLNPTATSPWVYIGGITTLPGSLDHWYWLGMGKVLSFQPTFAPGEPSGTVDETTEHCLSVGKVSGKTYYNDIRCNGLTYNFLCQTRDAYQDKTVKVKSPSSNRFKNYWHKQWRHVNISVYGTRNRTNNHVESLNKSITPHPNIWKFMEWLSQLDLDYSYNKKGPDAGEKLQAHNIKQLTISLKMQITNSNDVVERTKYMKRFLNNATEDIRLDIIIRGRLKINEMDEYDDMMTMME